MKRIGFGRVSQESNVYSPVRSEVADFERTHLLEGAGLLEACSRPYGEIPAFGRGAELSGFLRGLKDIDPTIEAVPLVSAWAVPGGPISEEALHELIDRLLASVRRAGHLDAVYLALHGAMRAVVDVDPEATILRALRNEIGPDVPLAVSWDLHGQMTRAKMEHVDIVTAYRTNPHRDHVRVGRRTGRIVARTVRGEVRPTQTWRTLPMVLGGGTTIDLSPTMWSIYAAMRRMERDPAVLYTALFNCHAWNDHPDLGWSVAVLTNHDAPLADRLADELADRAWELREVGPPEMPSAEEAVELALHASLARKLGIVCMSDASDMVGCGAPGESTALLRVLLERGSSLRTYASIRDATTVSELWEVPDGREVEVQVGGRLHPAMNAPLGLTGTVVTRRQDTPFGREVLLRSGKLNLVVTEQAPLAMKPSFYRSIGLDPWAADVVVVKSLFPFRWYFLPHARMTLYARTRGVTDLGLVRDVVLNDPVYPDPRVGGWRAVDQRRRLGT